MSAPLAPIDAFATPFAIGNWGDDDDLLNEVLERAEQPEEVPTEPTAKSRRESAAQIRAEKARRAAAEAAAKIADAETRHVLRQEQNAEKVAFIAAAKRGELTSKQCKTWSKKMPNLTGEFGEHWVDSTFAKMYGGAFVALDIDLLGRQAPLAVCIGDDNWAPFWTRAYWDVIQPPTPTASQSSPKGPSYNAPTTRQPLPAPAEARGAARFDSAKTEPVQDSREADRANKRDAEQAAIRANIDCFIAAACDAAGKLRANPQVDHSRGRCDPATCDSCRIMTGVKYAALQHRYAELAYLLTAFCVKPKVEGSPEMFSHIVAKHVNYIPDLTESCLRMCGLAYTESMEMSQADVRYNLSRSQSIEDLAATCPTRTCANGESAITTNNDVRTIRELTQSYKKIIALFAKDARARAQAAPTAPAATSTTRVTASTTQVTAPTTQVTAPATQITEPAVHTAPQIAVKTGRAWGAVPKVAAASMATATSQQSTPVVAPTVTAQVVEQQATDSFAKAAEVALHDTQLQQELMALKQQLAAQEAIYKASIEQMQAQLAAQLAAQMEAFTNMMAAHRPA
jgi:hypothetical protein